MTIRSARLPMLLVIETLWGWALVAIVAQAMSGDRGYGPSIFAVAAVVCGSAAVGAALRMFEVGEAQSRALGVASTVVGLAIILPLEYREAITSLDDRPAMIGATIAMAGLWIRGATRHDPDGLFEPIARSAVVGVIPVAIAAATQPAVHGPASFGAVAIVYVPLALLVLALHQAAEPTKRVETLATGWAPFAALTVLAGIAVAALAVAINPGGMFDVLSPVGDALAPVGEAFGRYVFGPIAAAMGWLVSLLPSYSGDQEARPQPPPERPPPKEDEEPSAWVEWLSWIARIAVPLIVVAAVLFALAMLFQMTRRKPERDEEDIVERGDEDGGEGPTGWLGSLRDRFGRRREPSSAVSIRRLYAEVLERAESDGIERAPAVTPLQFAPALDSRYGGTGTEITRAFIESRYGARDIGEERVRELRARWETQSRATS